LSRTVFKEAAHFCVVTLAATSGAVRIPRRRRNWWIEMVYTACRDAKDAWDAARESEAFMQREDDEYRQAYPPPRLKGPPGRDVA
jgi:hypothetical protein